jgi:type I restriction-modification system DNA methylase subunit
VTAFQIVKKELGALGYSGDLLQENYVFDDASDDRTKELRLPLGAFAQWPPSYRTACIGVIQANGNAGPRFVSSYHAFGAPMFLEVHEDHVVRYRMQAVGQAVELEAIPSRNIQKAFESNRDKWSPEAIFRAKAISPISLPSQLDFFDAGLLPALKGMIHRKLDRLLKETLDAAITTYRESTSGTSPDNTALFRLVFRFLAGKIFKDKKHLGEWSSPNPQTIVEGVQKFYGLEEMPSGRLIEEPHTKQVVWDHLRTAFNFQNLSEEDLAFVYENTLVTKEARRKHGIHATPSVVAELIVDRLPFEELHQDERFVLEPCAGHGVFLVAALRRLRDLLPASWTAQKRHVYLKERLKAIERDTFAGEVCRLSLTLADYPNPDGWEILDSDIFGTDALENALPKSRIVLCNPPFEDFNEHERKQYGNRIRSVHKPYEILQRVLEIPPAMLGFVLPKSAIMGGRYDELQGRIAGHYTNIETVALPDRVFAYSDQETMLVLASRPDPAIHARVFTKTFWVREIERESFLEGRQLPEAVTKVRLRADIKQAGNGICNPPILEVWNYLSEFRRLADICEIHRGIQWNISLSENTALLLSEAPQIGFKKGIDRATENLEPFWIKRIVYLNVEEKYRRRNAHFLPWEKPKVIVNAQIIGRGPWRICAFPDRKGLVCYQNFIGIWPRSALSIDAIAAILNSPVITEFGLLKVYLFHRWRIWITARLVN